VEPTPANVTIPADAGSRAICLRGSPWTLARSSHFIEVTITWFPIRFIIEKKHRFNSPLIAPGYSSACVSDSRPFKAKLIIPKSKLASIPKFFISDTA
jgi:hypothetical protein